MTTTRPVVLRFLSLLLTLAAVLLAACVSTPTDPDDLAQHGFRTSRPLAEETIFAALDLPTPNRLRTGAGTPGPDYWQQQADYTQLFRRVLIKNISEKVGEYQGVTYTLGRAIKRESDIAVASVLNRPGNAPNKVDWVVEAEGAPRVIDVIAEGTSLRLTQRSDYAAYLARNGNSVQALIDALKQQAAAG